MAYFEAVPWTGLYLLSRVQGCNIDFHPYHPSQDLELCHLMANAAKVVPSLHNYDQFLLISKYEAQQSTSASQLVDHLCQKVIINALQNAPGLLVPCCFAFYILKFFLDDVLQLLDI